MSRQAEMIEQAQAVIAEVKSHLEFAQKVARAVSGAVAYGLREQGLPNKAIAEILGESRNNINKLVEVGIWPRLSVDIPLGEYDHYDRMKAEAEQLYRPLGQPGSGWVHSRSGRSGQILEANGIPLPRAWQSGPGGLDADAAQLDNLDTGERILVYSLERHDGELLFNSNQQRYGTDGMGYYRIELCSQNGELRPLPLELLGLRAEDLRFGSKWPDPRQNRHLSDTYRFAMAAVRRHYGIWPLATVSEDPIAGISMPKG